MPAWVSNEINRFDNSAYEESNTEIGYAAADNAYLQTRYEIGPDQALIMRGRFPRCRFANVVLWNRFLQTFEFRDRRVSLNRKQIRLDDGSADGLEGPYTIVLAARDPGPKYPNWLDTVEHSNGTIFWRILLPEGQTPKPKCRVVKLADL